MLAGAFGMVVMFMVLCARTAAAATRGLHGPIHKIPETDARNRDNADNNNSCHFLIPFCQENFEIIPPFVHKISRNVKNK
jgi:hypothetical protein